METESYEIVRGDRLNDLLARVTKDSFVLETIGLEVFRLDDNSYLARYDDSEGLFFQDKFAVERYLSWCPIPSFERKLIRGKRFLDGRADCVRLLCDTDLFSEKSLDFSLESLKYLDERIGKEHSLKFFDRFLFTPLFIYVGEVLVKVTDGTWTTTWLTRKEWVPVIQLPSGRNIDVASILIKELQEDDGPWIFERVSGELQ